MDEKEMLEAFLVMLSSDWVEEYIRELPWSPEATDEERTLVAGNIRGFVGRMRRAVGISEN